MNELFKRTIEELFRDHGAPRDPKQVFDLCRLYELTNAVTRSGRSAEYLAMIRPAINVGNGIVLRRPSLGVSEFFEDCLEPWYFEDSRLYELAMIYCMANPEDVQLFAAVGTKSEMTRKIKAFIRTVPMNETELVILARNFLKLSDESEEEILHEAQKADGKNDCGWMIEMLCRDYALTPEQVVWKLSNRETKLLVESGCERRREDAAVKAGRPVTMNPAGRAGMALKAFYAMKEAIERDFKRHG